MVSFLRQSAPPHRARPPPPLPRCFGPLRGRVWKLGRSLPALPRPDRGELSLGEASTVRLRGEARAFTRPLLASRLSKDCGSWWRDDTCLSASCLCWDIKLSAIFVDFSFSK